VVYGRIEFIVMVVWWIWACELRRKEVRKDMVLIHPN
jgi:hypothetical protein